MDTLTRTCSVCRVAKPYSEFYFRPTGKHGCESKCIECYKLRNDRPKFEAPEWDGTSTKLCIMCGAIKPLPEFNFSRRDGIYGSYCKPCHSERLKKSKRNTSIKKRYGITAVELDVLMYQQGWKCMICEALFEPDSTHMKPYVDHDHNTGKVRGVLCRNCNTLLGIYKEDIQRLKTIGYQKHAEYLEKFL